MMIKPVLGLQPLNFGKLATSPKESPAFTNARQVTNCSFVPKQPVALGRVMHNLPVQDIGTLRVGDQQYRVELPFTPGRLESDVFNPEAKFTAPVMDTARLVPVSQEDARDTLVSLPTPLATHRRIRHSGPLSTTLGPKQATKGFLNALAAVKKHVATVLTDAATPAEQVEQAIVVQQQMNALKNEMLRKAKNAKSLFNQRNSLEFRQYRQLKRVFNALLNGVNTEDIKGYLDSKSSELKAQRTRRAKALSYKRFLARPRTAFIKMREAQLESLESILPPSLRKTLSRSKVEESLYPFRDRLHTRRQATHLKLFKGGNVGTFIAERMKTGATIESAHEELANMVAAEARRQYADVLTGEGIPSQYHISATKKLLAGASRLLDLKSKSTEKA